MEKSEMTKPMNEQMTETITKPVTKPVTKSVTKLNHVLQFRTKIPNFISVSDRSLCYNHGHGDTSFKSA